VKLTKSPCRIVGVRVGEINADLLSATRLSVRFVLLRDPESSDGLNAGQYSKDRDFSPRTIEAFEKFVECLEEDALVELFQVEDHRLDEMDSTPEQREEKESEKDSLIFPTLGGGKGTPQV
jgi:hypothetical protein